MESNEIGKPTILQQLNQREQHIADYMQRYNEIMDTQLQCVARAQYNNDVQSQEILTNQDT